MSLPYASVQDAAIALRDYAFRGFSVLPFNRWDIDHSQHWWLSPTSQKIAFPYGKVILTQSSWVPADNVFVGFCVEKGVLFEGEWNRNNIMKDDWFWHRFLDVANVPLASAVHEASLAVGRKITIHVDSGTLVDRNWASVQFDAEGGRLVQTSYIEGNRTLGTLASSASFAEFADSLRAINGATSSAWQWIDVVVGTDFSMSADEPTELDECAKMLTPFKHWMTAR